MAEESHLDCYIQFFVKPDENPYYCITTLDKAPWTYQKSALMLYLHFHYLPWMSKSVKFEVVLIWQRRDIREGSVEMIHPWILIGKYLVIAPTTIERWTLLRVKSSLDLLRFFLDQKVTAQWVVNAQLLPNSPEAQPLSSFSLKYWCFKVELFKQSSEWF